MLSYILTIRFWLYTIILVYQSLSFMSYLMYLTYTNYIILKRKIADENA